MIATVADADARVSNGGTVYIHVRLRPLFKVDPPLWAYIGISPRSDYWKRIARAILNEYEWAALELSDRTYTTPDDYFIVATELVMLLPGKQVRIAVRNVRFQDMTRQEVRWILG